MIVRKSRWSGVYESAEEELVALLTQRHIQAVRWDGDEGEIISDRRYDADTQLWCAEGQLRCEIDGKAYSLQPGDVLDIPADTIVTLQVGFGGCATYESSAQDRPIS
jgi:quercetin dioxygenase-like cupin family protein